MSSCFTSTNQCGESNTTDPISLSHTFLLKLLKLLDQFILSREEEGCCHNFHYTHTDTRSHKIVTQIHCTPAVPSIADVPIIGIFQIKNKTKQKYVHWNSILPYSLSKLGKSEELVRCSTSCVEPAFFLLVPRLTYMNSESPLQNPA